MPPGAAYCCIDGCEAWNCNVCKKYPGMANVTEFHSTKVFNVHGFIGYDREYDSIILSFTGTDPFSIADW